MITRSDVEALIPEDVSKEIFKTVAESSMIMKLGRKLPNLAAGVRRMPVMSALPMAYFVDGVPGDVNPSGDNAVGFKQTTTAEWKNKFLYAEEIACIVPIPISALEDASYDIWGEIKPYIGEAMGAVFDAAVLHGTNAPASWPDDLVLGATTAGNVVALGDLGDLYDDVMGYDAAADTPGLISHVETDGYLPTGFVSGVTMRGRLRGLRADNGAGLPLFKPAGEGMKPATSPDVLDGLPLYFSTNGALDESEALLIVGDWNKLVYAFRSDLTYKILTEAVIQDPTTQQIIYNLAQQDMVALRCYMRIGWQLPNPVNRVNTDEATRYPFAVLTPGSVSP